MDIRYTNGKLSIGDCLSHAEICQCDVVSIEVVGRFYSFHILFFFVLYCLYFVESVTLCSLLEFAALNTMSEFAALNPMSEFAALSSLFEFVVEHVNTLFVFRISNLSYLLLHNFGFSTAK